MVNAYLPFFQHFNIMLTDTNTTSYYKHLEIDHKTLTKMKFVLNNEGAQVLKDQMGVQDEEEHGEEEEEFGVDNEFINMFEMSHITSSFEDIGSNS